MNDQQLRAVAAVSAGHNVYVGGAAGTGKSFFVAQAIEWARHQGMKTALTCTTGIACCCYDQTLKATTVHKWAGIGDGRYTGQQLSNSMDHDPNYQESRDRLQTVEFLTIDEVSMLSMEMLDKLDFVMRNVRKSEKIFGGAQILLVGDFLQLPPVRNIRYHDTGDFCFNSECFPQPRIFLTQAMRHTDIVLHDVVNAVAVGHVPAHIHETIQGLNRHIVVHVDDSTKLFPTNLQVDMYNRDRLVELRGQLYQFTGVDEGDPGQLDRLTVQKTLWLKDGAQVMLLRNLSDHLVNGLQGSVRAVREGEVDVYFPTLQQVTTLTRMPFTVYDPSTNCNLAVRSQIPLKLSYAMTIHKAQGMTLERVEVDCSQIFQPGQLGVAMGRVRTLDGLRVVNFDTAAIIPQPVAVTDFLFEQSAPMKDDKSCCHIRSDINNYKTTIINELDGEMKDDAVVDGLVKQILFDYTTPTSFDCIKELDIKSQLIDNPTNNTQKEFNNLVLFILKNPQESNVFFGNKMSKISKLFNEKKSIVGFYKEFQTYITSDEYQVGCRIFYPDHYANKSKFLLSYKIMALIREVCVRKDSGLLPVGDSQKKLLERKLDKNITSTESGKVRYVGGYVVAKLFNTNVQKIRQSAFKCSKKDIDTYENAKHTIEYLNLMKATECTLVSSKYKESLDETKRKQNINNGLTNITDATYEFFLVIVSKILCQLTSVNLSAHGSAMYSHLMEAFACDTAGFQAFTSLFSDIAQENISPHTYGNNEDIQSCVDNLIAKVCVLDDLFHAILKNTVSVFLKQFTKDIMDSMNITKKMEHRKEVRVAVPKPVQTISAVTNSNSCAKCNKCDNVDGDWICCDQCRRWLHRKCAGLSAARKWSKYQKCNASFHCYLCM